MVFKDRRIHIPEAVLREALAKPFDRCGDCTGFVPILRAGGGGLGGCLTGRGRQGIFKGDREKPSGCSGVGNRTALIRVYKSGKR